jgi:hypothetical protein
MRYRLRTLLILLALGPPLLAGLWSLSADFGVWREEEKNRRFEEELLKAMSDWPPCQPYPGLGS